MALDDDWVVIPLIVEEPQIYTCAACGTHVCTEENIESKQFTTMNGRGFLVRNVVNITNGPPDTRNLKTGVHTCEDVSCVVCDVSLGWQYTETAEKDQRYKIGMCVLEAVKLTKSGWDKDDLGNNETTNSGDG